VPQEDRLIVLCVWNALVVFVSLFFLTGALGKSVLVSAFVLVSSLLGFGQRWLLRGGFGLAVLAIAVVVGVIPHPDQWKDALRDVRAFLEYRVNGVGPTAIRTEQPPIRPVVNSEQLAGSTEPGRW
jgi:hypothetical protein